MSRRTYRTAKGKKRRKQEKQRAIILLVIAILSVLVIFLICKNLFFSNSKNNDQEVMQDMGEDADLKDAPPLDVQLLTANEFSRPQIALKKVKGIVIHYTANPGSTAQENRNYFENLKDEKTTKASSHFIIGLDGEIVQCIPSSEISYASNDRNSDTLSIECCHPDESGKYNEETYQSVTQLTGWLCKRYGLSSKDVIRHYDITGKLCPKYFVEHEDAWEQFLKDVDAEIDKLK